MEISKLFGDDQDKDNAGWHCEIMSEDGELVIDSQKIFFLIDVDKYDID